MGFLGALDLKSDFWESSILLYGKISTAKCVSACKLGLDIRIFGMIFRKRKKIRTNPATRPLRELAGRLDVK